MTDIAIRVENLGKRYKLGGQKNGSFRESMTNLFKRNGHALITQTPEANEFWALQDVSFEIKRGEAVGIIGRNGAGKSTLLKILSRITEPTKGRFEIFGRVSSLLEVGTGFHEELTGRENIYLNGTILGMRRAEVKAKFDEIVAFSGVEKFIDTPVKHYSSGMKVRLAFAVAAHLEPEILIIDEVLAVGDAEFQRKCLGKMEDVTGQGRTVLFVSHNMAAVSALCCKAILLNKGKKYYEGIVGETINLYLENGGKVGNAIKERKDRKGSGKLVFTDASCSYRSEGIDNVLMCGKDAYFNLFLSSEYEYLKNVSVVISIKDQYENVMFVAHTRFTGFEIKDFKRYGKITCKIPSIPLLPGKYKLTVRNLIGGQSGLNGAEVGDHLENAIEFVVSEFDFFGTGELPDSKKHGCIVVNQHWCFESYKQHIYE